MSRIEAYYSWEANPSHNPISTQITLNNLATQNAQLPPFLETSNVRQELYKEPWYEKLLILWYLLSITVAADLLFNFPWGLQSYGLTLSFGGVMEQYLTWALLDLAILWFATLVFLDQHIQRAWEELGFKRLTSGKITTIIAWSIVILTLVGVSGSYNLQTWRLQ